MWQRPQIQALPRPRAATAPNAATRPAAPPPARADGLAGDLRPATSAGHARRAYPSSGELDDLLTREEGGRLEHFLMVFSLQVGVGL